MNSLYTLNNHLKEPGYILAVDLIVGADVEKLNGIIVKISIDDAHITGNGEGTKPFVVSLERMISK